jgi:hypothetical protein
MVNSERKAKQVDYAILLTMMPIFSKFPRLHNQLKDDFNTMLEIAETLKNDLGKFRAQCNACIKGFFSMIEADLFYYNLFDPYKGYDDRDPFFQKFKDTFKQICKTWDRENLQEEYFSRSLQLLKVLKEKRDKLNHPKDIIDIASTSIADLEKVKIVFAEYDTFFSNIMENFFIKAVVPMRL